MRNTNKKGFTIVELVIVVAVIAILAAVLIPTFSGLIKKAQQSADHQAVSQMNTILASAQAINDLIVEGNDAETSINIYNALIAEGFSYEFDAYYEKYGFGYVVENGNAVIVLVEDGKVAYPKNHEGKTDYKQFFTAVENADELVDAFNTGYVLLKTDAVFTEAIGISNDVTIVGNNKILNDAHLTQDSGANSAININNATEDITVNMSGITISNPDDTSARGLNLSSNSGKVTMVLDNVNIDSHYYAFNIAGFNTGGLEIVVKNSTISGWAALNVWSQANVTFENCTIVGNAKSNEGFGSIVLNDNGTHTAAGSTLTFKNCTIEANNVSEGSGMVMLDARCAATVTFEGCTFKVNGEKVDTLTYANSGNATVTVK